MHTANRPQTFNRCPLVPDPLVDSYLLVFHLWRKF